MADRGVDNSGRYYIQHCFIRRTSDSTVPTDAGYIKKFHIHVSVSDLYIPTIGLCILLQEHYVYGPILGIYKSLTDT